MLVSQLVALVESRVLDFGRRVTHRYPLADVDRAFADLTSKPRGFVKGVVLPLGS